MSISSDGQLCYGIKLDEDTPLPWEEGKWINWDFDDWWIAQCGYKPLFSLYDEQGGNYLPGPKPSEEKKDKYYAHRRAFLDAHPLPVELVNYCSYDYPMYIVAIPSTVLKCHRGYPKRFSPTQIEVDRCQPFVNAPLVRFVEKYISHDHEEPKWWLSSLYG